MKRIARGFLIVLTLVFGPYVIAGVVTRAWLAAIGSRGADIPFSIALLWSWLALPFFWVLPAWPDGWDVVGTLIVWIGVGLIVGYLTARQSFRGAFFWAGVSIFIVSAAMHLLIPAVGYRIVVEGP